MTGIALQALGIAKAYDGVVALHGVDLAIPAGTVYALCGDNGAGKSTLVRVLSGAHAPGGGALQLFGRSVQFASPLAALREGIATIYQDLALAPRLSIWQNVFMGAERVRRLLPGITLLDRRAMRRDARALLAQLHHDIADVDRPVAELSGGQRQAVAIARALLWQARVVIMDEPTAALGVRETAEVLALIRRLREQQVTVVLVSHNMEDVVAVADRVAILKAGRVVVETAVAGLDAVRLAQAVMTGVVPPARAA